MGVKGTSGNLQADFLVIQLKRVDSAIGGNDTDEETGGDYKKTIIYNKRTQM